MRNRVLAAASTAILTAMLGAALITGPAVAAGKCTDHMTPGVGWGDPVGPGQVLCGTVGNDTVDTLVGGIFNGLGGADVVGVMGNGGVFNGGDGDDRVWFLDGGTFNGGAGADQVGVNCGTPRCQSSRLDGGTFNAGTGDDRVLRVFSGEYSGGPGDDSVVAMSGGTFAGGSGKNDSVESYVAGTCYSVESGC